jgi:hypothetical protein
MKQSIRSLSRLWLWVLALLVAQQTQAQLLTEDFPNAGVLANNGWTQVGTSAVNPISAGTPNLTYAGLSTNGNAAILTNNGQDVSRGYTAQTSGAVYASCLVNITSAQTGDYFFHLANTAGGTSLYSRLFVKSVTGGIQFGIAKNGTAPAYASAVYALNTTYFIVIKYTYNPGTNDDVASVFINPALGGSEPTSAATDAIGTDATSSAGIGAVNLRQGTAAAAPNAVVDFIRVGTNWADVTQAPAPVATLSVNPTALSGFSTTQGTPSATQTYALTGSTLSADVTVTAPAGYEVSQDGTNFQNTITVVRSNGSVNATITVRLTGASAGSPSGSITNGSGSASTNVTVSGTVNAPNSPSLTINPSTLSGFSTTQGTPSAIQTYALSGSNLTSDVTVTAPAGYQVSLDGTTFQNTVTATQTNGAVNATVLVQLAGTSAGVFSGSITNASVGVTTVSVPVSGTVGSNSPYTPIVLARSSVGQTVTIAGRVTVTNQLGSRQIYIQDNTGGIVVYSGSTGTDLSTLVQLGDSVQARGPITVFNGFTEITSAAATNFTIVSGAGTRVPTPIAITPDQLPNYQGQLVSVTNASITPVASTFSGGTNYTITANGQSATLRIGANSPLAGAGQPANPVSVTGIADRFVSGATTAGTNGIQLQPRILADIPGSTPAQDLTCTAGMSNSTLGTDQTLDIATWNMEFFGADAGTIICPNGNLNYNDMGPTNEDLQQSNAVTVLSKLKADIIGVEEVSNLDRLAATVASLPGSYSYTCSDRFSYYFQNDCDQTPSGNPPTVFGPTSLAQKVCVIYNRATVTPVLAETKALLTDKYSYPSANNWSSGRLPFLFVGDVTINGVTQRVHVVTIHAKSGSATTDYNRRKQDIIDLKANLDATYPNAKLIIVGDYNDKLNNSIASGQESSYKPFVDDASNYSALTQPLETNGCSTFNSSASFIDHMIISNELAPAAISNSTYVLQPFSIPNYGNTTSDHNPVVTRFDLTKLVTPVTALTVTASANPTQITTNNNAIITAQASGGTAPYSYSFSGPGTIEYIGSTASVSSLSAGVQTFTVTATDATTPTAQTSFTTVSVTVIQGNRPPVAISSLLSSTVTVGQSFSVDARTLFTDPDGDSLTITLGAFTGFPLNGNILSRSPSQVGQYGVDLFVYDASSVGYGRFILTVIDNTAPVIANAIAPQSATAGSAYTLSLAGVFTDSETPNQLTLSASGLPEGLSLSGTSISGTPLTTVGSPYTVTVTATDPGSLSTSTVFTITVNPAGGNPNPNPTVPFSITSVSLNGCEQVTASERRVTLTPNYAGLSGESIRFRVANEIDATTAAGPYTLRLYTDNPVISLRATQGNGSEVSYRYNWLAACTTTTPGNTPPVAAANSDQSATVGTGFTYTVQAFSDAQTPSQLTYSATISPANGLSFDPATRLISGTPTAPGVSRVSITATDGGNLSTSTVFTITVNPAGGNPNPNPTVPFSITSVSLNGCEQVTASERRVTLTPNYAGLSGESIRFRVANETLPTTGPAPYTLRLYTDNPVISLRAVQGSGAEVSYSYNWLAVCNTNSRIRVQEQVEPLTVTVLGNPVVGETVNVEIRGADGQSVRVLAVDGRGYTVSDSRIEQATGVEKTAVRLGRTPGIYLLQISTASQQQTVKLIRE